MCEQLGKQPYLLHVDSTIRRTQVSIVYYFKRARNLTLSEDFEAKLESRSGFKLALLIIIANDWDAFGASAAMSMMTWARGVRPSSNEAGEQSPFDAARTKN